jgi:NADP+-dependent farnesol dehydrogenase
MARQSKGIIHAVKCDLMKGEDIVNAFKWIESNLGGVDLLVNNAGAMPLFPLIGMICNVILFPCDYDDAVSDGSSEGMLNTFELNVIALTLCTREALKTMRKRGDNGHIIHVNR